MNTINTNKSNVITIVNTTPHEVKIVDTEGNVVKTFAPSGLTIRLAQETVTVGSLDGVSLTRTVYGEPAMVSAEGQSSPLPEVKEGTYYLVSAMIKGALPERADLLVPAEQVRDEAGRVVGCRSLGV